MSTSSQVRVEELVPLYVREQTACQYPLKSLSCHVRAEEPFGLGEPGCQQPPLPGRAASPSRRSIYSGRALGVRTSPVWQQSAGLMKRLQGQYCGSDSFSHSCPRGACLNTQAGETICTTTGSVLRVQWRTHTADSCGFPRFPTPPRQVVKKRTGSCMLCFWRHSSCVLHQPQLAHSPLGTGADEFSADQPHWARSAVGNRLLFAFPFSFSWCAFPRCWMNQLGFHVAFLKTSLHCTGGNHHCRLHTPGATQSSLRGHEEPAIALNRYPQHAAPLGYSRAALGKLAVVDLHEGLHVSRILMKWQGWLNHAFQNLQHKVQGHVAVL